MFANWALYKHTTREEYRSMALECSKCILKIQRDDGAWEYSFTASREGVATVQGNWGGISLLESYRHEADQALLHGVIKWHDYLIKNVGFQRLDHGLAIDSFDDDKACIVPNDSADVLRFLAEMYQVTGDGSYLEPCTGLLIFLEDVQKKTGEFPYILSGKNGKKGRQHFQCYQYNAFQCMSLMRYYEATGDETPIDIIENLLKFLSTGIADDGHVYFQCDKRYYKMTCHATAVGAAFVKAMQLGIADYDHLAQRIFAICFKTTATGRQFSSLRLRFKRC